MCNLLSLSFSKNHEKSVAQPEYSGNAEKNRVVCYHSTPCLNIIYCTWLSNDITGKQQSTLNQNLIRRELYCI